MRIVLIDPFLDISHAYWANGLQQFSNHEIIIYSNPPRNWKWQMVGGTLEMAKRIESEIESFDLIVVTDMLDLPCFLGYLNSFKIPKVIIYFHENQITYPWSPDDKDKEKGRDHHYGFMNLRSAIVADKIVFNSQYHKKSFLSSLPNFVKRFPSYSWNNELTLISAKSSVLPIGIDFSQFHGNTNSNEKPIFIWNHRWEYDKEPTLFFETLITLKAEKIDFGLIVLGKPYQSQPEIFDRARDQLSMEIIHWGYVENKQTYYQLLSRANIVLVTGKQDFFGISIVEAIVSGCYPILPNRLAYPEHVPPCYHKEVLYEKEEILDNVKAVINNKSFLDTYRFQQYIKKYKCEEVIKNYDEFFENARL